MIHSNETIRILDTAMFSKFQLDNKIVDNLTYSEDFHILAFTDTSANHRLLFLFFLLIYWAGILGNSLLITLVFKDSHLHNPMYFLLCNLSILDVCFPSATIPKLMEIVLTKNTSITEAIVLSSMAYDRYVAICHPLQYYLIMNEKKYALIMGGPWILGLLNSVYLTFLCTRLLFCGEYDIHSFFCNIKSLSKISCGSAVFQNMIFAESLMFGLFQVLLILISYIKIVMVLLRMKYRLKILSSCSSHLITLFIFYGRLNQIETNILF
ncbi:hypothetical protein GDO86_019500 [Hymenochirus boettgeri]|uniref:Olfactory receptor n=1 Tax=Hymenochirus boettgeri TaxID=247094 RepID=A0A8T2I956_9PIPI|nr:hypothetical protein GDO86_019500 [Hymenochirus boettgeri]